ncbi:MAG: TonB-dependent receptor [Flavobacteriaceae bacterium]|nr:TonB-dependent receptor [Flavobacteriaceae bacterium]
MFLFFMIGISSVIAQQKSVTGVVIDQEGLPLPGVSIVLEGTTKGTQTDFDGNYKIDANVGQVLVFSYIGQKTVKRTIGSSNTINVQMEEDSQALEEVIVVAYGTQRKEAVTGAVDVVSSKDLESRIATSPIAAIEGKATGVQFLSGSGQPGSSPGIVIRGVGTLNGSTDPLIILDGVQFDGSLSLINQDDIKSMTVLKDAASTSLYGSRAANGVIIITTKNGTSGKLQVNVSTSYGMISRSIDDYEKAGTGNYYELMWEAYKNTLTSADPGADASATLYNRLGYNPFNVPNDQIVDANGKLNPNAKIIYKDLNWLDILERTGSRKNYSMNVSSGGENHSVYFSTSYLKEDGYVIESEFERITNRLNAEFKATDWLTVGGNLSLAITESNGPTGSGGGSIVNPFNWAINLAPIYPVYLQDRDGNYVLDANGGKQYDLGEGNVDLGIQSRPYNPGRHGIAELVFNDNLIKQNNLGFRNYADIQIIDGLKAKITYGLDIQDYLNKEYENHIVGDGAPSGRYQETRFRRTIENFTQLLTYNKSFNDIHNFDITLGHESLDRNYSEVNGIANTQTATGIYEFDNFAAGDNVGGFSTDRTLEGYFARLNYNFDNKYFLSGSVRRDGTSVFSSDVRWGTFFSVGASWNIHKENFMENVDFVDNLKLRASYGEIGNDDLNNFYISQGLYTILANAGDPGIFWSSTGNKLLTWENQVSWDAALDFGLFNNMIDGSVEFYRKTSVDLLFNKPIPLSEGLNEAPQNIGDIYNQGVEVSLNGHFFKGRDFTWDIGLQASTFKNEITKLDAPSDNGSKRWEEGRSRYDYYIYHYAGVDPDNGDALYYMWEDNEEGKRVAVLNPDGTQATTNNYQEAGEAFTGDSSIPDVLGSVSNRFSYKNFSLDFLVTFGIGGKILDNGYSSLMHPGTYGRALHVDANNAWREPGDITDVPRLETGNPNQTVGGSTRFLTDASYWSLRNVNLSYDLGDKISEKLGLNNLRFFITGENLFISAKRKGINPQQGLSGVVGGNSFNPARVVSVGLNASF